MNFLSVAKNDVTGLLKNRFLRIATIIIMAIPLIYGGTYLASMWDPYSRTSHLSVAVVNLDQGGTYDDAEVNFGSDIVDNLRNNDDLGWRFVKTEKEAQNGLKGDKYYAILIIPKDFSQKIIDVNNGIVEKPQITFIQNEKENYVVGVITDKASIAVKDSIAKSISTKFSDEVFDSLFQVRDGMEAAADGTYQLKDGITNLKDAIPAMSSGLDELSTGSDSLTKKLQDAYDGSNKLRNGIGTIKDKIPDLADGVNKLYIGTDALNKNMSDALDGSRNLRDGTLQLSDMIPSVTDGVNELKDGSTSLKEGLGELNDKIPDLMNGVSDLKHGAEALDGGVINIQDGANQLDSKTSGIPALKNGADQLEAGVIENINEALTPAVLTQLKDGMGTILQGMQKLDGTVKTLPMLAPYVTQWTNDYNTLTSLASIFSDAAAAIQNNDTNSEIAALIKIAPLLQRSSSSVKDSKLDTITSDMKTMADALAPYSASPQLSPVCYGLNSIYGGLNTLNTSLDSLRQTLPLLQGLSQLSSGLGQASTGMDSLVSGLATLRGGSARVRLGAEELYDKTQGLQDGVEDLYSGSKNLSDGLDQFNNTVPTLTSVIDQVADGSRDLTDGLFKLNSSTDSMKEKVGELNQKVPDLEQGTKDLYDGSVDLSDGILKLHDGASTLNSGVKSIKDKVPDLSDGVNKIYEGVTQLNDNMVDGAQKLSDKLVAGSKTMGDFAADPVKVDNAPLYKVDKYGYGLSPNFMSLGLWVGALLMFFILNDEVKSDMNVNARNIVLGKYLTYGIIGTAQAVFLSIFVLKLGLTPPNLFIYFTFNIFLSWVFIAIMQNFIFVLGDVGRVLSIVALILQLTSSGGTFPRELLPRFFRVINPFLPFTYSISAMREINSGINYSILDNDIWKLAIYLVVFLTLTLILKEKADKVKGQVSLESQREKMLNQA